MIAGCPDDLRKDQYVRQKLLIPHLLPFSSATLWRKVNSGEFPAPKKLSARITAWRIEEVRAWMSNYSKPY
jgi:prophage regulatory protein